MRLSNNLQLSATILVAVMAVAIFSQTANSAFSDAEIKEFLDAHNKARAAVGSPPLSWNATLQEYAEKYAAVRSADCAAQHSDGPYGENIVEANADLKPAQVVKYWEDEKPYFNYDSNSCIDGKECHHYTQLVWSDSVTVGCAKTKCTNKPWWFFTCNYFPAADYQDGLPPY